MLSDGTLEVGDLVVGADGVHSSVRAETVGDAAPRFSGMSAYRAKVPREALDFDDVVRNWMGPDRHLVAYPVGAGSAYLSIVAVVPEHESTAESWPMPGSADELRNQLHG
jgi:salicylate hydroxylase